MVATHDLVGGYAAKGAKIAKDLEGAYRTVVKNATTSRCRREATNHPLAPMAILAAYFSDPIRSVRRLTDPSHESASVAKRPTTLGAHGDLGGISLRPDVRRA